MQQDRTRCSEVGAGATEGGAGAKKKSTVGAGAARSEQCSKVGADAGRSYQEQRGGTRCSEVGACGARSPKQKITKTHCPPNSLVHLHRRAKK